MAPPHPPLHWQKPSGDPGLYKPSAPLGGVKAGPGGARTPIPTGWDKPPTSVNSEAPTSEGLNGDPTYTWGSGEGDKELCEGDWAHTGEQHDHTTIHAAKRHK